MAGMYRQFLFWYWRYPVIASINMWSEDSAAESKTSWPSCWCVLFPPSLLFSLSTISQVSDLISPRTWFNTRGWIFAWGRMRHTWDWIIDVFLYSLQPFPQKKGLYKFLLSVWGLKPCACVSSSKEKRQSNLLCIFKSLICFQRYCLKSFIHFMRLLKACRGNKQFHTQGCMIESLANQFRSKRCILIPQ